MTESTVVLKTSPVLYLRPSDNCVTEALYTAADVCLCGLWNCLLLSSTETVDELVARRYSDCGNTAARPVDCCCPSNSVGGYGD